MPNFNFLACLKLRYRDFTYISLNHPSLKILILCLCMSEEHNRLILTSYHVPKLRYRAHSRKYKPVIHCTESLERDDIEYLVYR